MAWAFDGAGVGVLDNRFWWNTHRLTQYSGVALMSVGVWLMWSSGTAIGASALAQWHGTAGWTLLGLGWLQIAGAHLRGSKGGPSDVLEGKPLRGDHYDMTLHRRIFEWFHKVLGYGTLLASAWILGSGLVLSDSPRWMALGAGAWLVLLVVFFIALERRGYVRTYPALWGKKF